MTMPARINFYISDSFVSKILNLQYVVNMSVFVYAYNIEYNVNDTEF